MDEYAWTEDASAVDFAELSELYRIAPLGIKPPDALKTVFGHSMFVCFAYAGDVLAGAGRVLADGLERCQSDESPFSRPRGAVPDQQAEWHCAGTCECGIRALAGGTKGAKVTKARFCRYCDRKIAIPRPAPSPPPARRPRAGQVGGQGAPMSRSRSSPNGRSASIGSTMALSQSSSAQLPAGGGRPASAAA